jgi:hypothetical protein
MQMPGKRLQHLVRPALGVHRCGQMGVQVLDCHTGEFPGARAPAQDILGPVRVVWVSVSVIRFHKRCHPYGGKKNLPNLGRFFFHRLID